VGLGSQRRAVNVRVAKLEVPPLAHPGDPYEVTVEGTRFEGEEFLNRVQLSRPGSLEQWPDFEGNFCEIKEGGDAAGQDMSGKCAFAFTNGYFVTAEFKCTLEEVQP